MKTLYTTEAPTELREWQKTFVRIIREGLPVAAACRIAGVSWTTAHQTRKASHLFARAWDDGLKELERRITFTPMTTDI